MTLIARDPPPMLKSGVIRARLFTSLALAFMAACQGRDTSGEGFLRLDRQGVRESGPRNVAYGVVVRGWNGTEGDRNRGIRG